MVRRWSALSMILGIGAALLVSNVGTASAATHDVWGELNTGGYLVQYSTFRSHISGGASLRIYNNTGHDNHRYSRFGLRNTSGTQITHTNQYNGSGGDQVFRRSSNNSTTIPTGDYALNGRMADASGHGCDNVWAGTLVL